MDTLLLNLVFTGVPLAEGLGFEPHFEHVLLDVCLLYMAPRS